MVKLFMADPPCRRSAPEYHALVAIRELPSCEAVALTHPDHADGVAEELNKFLETINGTGF